MTSSLRRWRHLTLAKTDRHWEITCERCGARRIYLDESWAQRDLALHICP